MQGNDKTNTALTQTPTEAAVVNKALESHMTSTVKQSIWLKAFTAILVLTMGMVGQVQADTQTRISAFVYNADGLLTKEIIEPDNSNLCLVKVYTYDTFGNQKTVTTRNCNGSAGTHSGINSEAAMPTGDAKIKGLAGWKDTTGQWKNVAFIADSGFTTTTNYDAIGRFATSSSNAAGHSESYTYSYRLGVRLSLTGPNSLTTSWTYDGFGREIKETRADDTTTTTTYAKCTTGCPTINTAVAKYTIKTTTTGAPYSKAYFDKLGRAIKSETQDINSAVINSETWYDQVGHQIKESLPYKTGTTKYYTETTYDDLDRVTSVKEPNGDTSITTYDGFRTTMKNPNDQHRYDTHDNQGKLVEVEDAFHKVLKMEYDAYGNLVKTKDAKENETVIAYDKAGRKIRMADSDQGVIEYRYNALGQLVYQRDSRLNETKLHYDKLGRQAKREEDGLTSEWFYDTCDSTHNPGGKCKGKLTFERTDNGLDRVYMFDTLGRATGELNDYTQETLHDYGITKLYDSAGRVSSIAYPQAGNGTPLNTYYTYSSTGILNKVAEGTAQTAIWTAGVTDSAGRLKTYTNGNGVVDTTNYNAQTGRIDSVQSQKAGSANLVLQNYSYDKAGNLTKTIDSVTSLTDVFGYDALNRLTSATATGGGQITTQTMTYNSIGNITKKTYKTSGYNNLDENYKLDYLYASYNHALGKVRAHAVSSVSKTVISGDIQAATYHYSYDANGNQAYTTDQNNKIIRAISWTSWNMPDYINGSGHNTPDGIGSSKFTFKYNASHERAYQELPDGTKIYNVSPRIDSGIHVERREKPDGSIKMAYSLYAGSYPIGQRVHHRNSAGALESTTTTYYHKDRLGSILVTTDSTGNLVDRRSYDAWGKRRNTNGTEAARSSNTGEVRHGFTGHEELNEAGLVHMNGRVYDPMIGRFLSPDPQVQYPELMQNYNRYSYINNSPLRSTDPSGYGFFDDFFAQLGSMFGANPVLRIGVSVAMVYFAPVQVFGITKAAMPIASGAVNGAAAGAITSGGNLRATIAGGISGAAFSWAGTQGTWALDSYRLAAHGAAGCVSAAAGGGNCATGAVSAVASKYATGSIPSGVDGWSDGARFTATVVTGGTASVLGGGKFANGAQSAAFAFILNACSAGKCWTTARERELLYKSGYDAYYTESCSGGDLVACAYGDIARGKSDIARFTTNRLQSAALDERGKPLSKSELNQIRYKLAVNHANLLGSSKDTAVQPDSKLETKSHWSVLAQHGISSPSAFGGTPLGAIHLLIGPWFTESYNNSLLFKGRGWCPGCK